MKIVYTNQDGQEASEKARDACPAALPALQEGDYPPGQDGLRLLGV